MPTYKIAILTAVLIGGHVSGLLADDWPMLGRDGNRNAVSPEKNPPTFWQIEEIGKAEPTVSKNVRWRVELGPEVYGSPVISDGLVWIGTTRYGAGTVAGGEGEAALLRCYREHDGKLLYEYVSPRLKSRFEDPPWWGLSSSPSIDGDQLWFFTNRCETVCLDIGPLKRGTGEPEVLWKADLKELGIQLRPMWMWPARLCSPSQPYEGRIYVTVPNGINHFADDRSAPDAPSLACLDKDTGAVIWTDSSPGANVLLSEFSSPLVANIGGRGQVIVAQGDGWVRSFEPASGALIWEFDGNLKASSFNDHRGTRNYFLTTPVLYEDRIYIGNGREAQDGEGPGRLVCIDPTKNGDISTELAVDRDGNPLPHRRIQAVDPQKGERAIANPNSGLVWEYTKFDRNGDGEIDFTEEFHRSLSNVAIKDGLLIAADHSGLLHCLDAKTGNVHWAYDCFADVWASPLIVDDNVYVADGDGEVAILRLTDEAQEPLREISLTDWIYSSPVFANGTLYVANRNSLFAIASEGQPVIDGHWPQWRGPGRDNVSTETGLLKEWPEDGPPLVWRAEGLGEGIASVAVVGGRLFTISRQESEEFIVALDEGSGRHLWSAYLGCTIPQSHLMQWLTQRAPTVENDHLYAVSGLGDLVCLQTADGKELWRKSYEEDLQGQRGYFGFGDRPLVDGDRLIIMPGGITASVTALNRWTGEVLWTCAIPSEKHWPGGDYSAGVIADIHGVRQFVVSLNHCSVGIAVDDGRLLWRYEAERTPTNHNTLTPFVRDRYVVIPMGYSQQLLSLEIVTRGDGYAAQEVYAVRARLDPFQDNTCLVGDHFYAFGNIASCHLWNTGDVVWEARIAEQKAAGTFADGRAYIRDTAGIVQLLQVTPEGLVKHGKFTLPDIQPASATTLPVIAGGRLYLRDNTRLFCFDVRADAFEQPRPSVKTISLPAPGAGLAPPAGRSRTGVNRAPDAVFVPTPQDVVERMLELAGIKKQEVVYDLGSGDGRIVIAAAKTYGVQAVGVELDPELIKLSQQRVQESKLTDLVTLRHEDMFQVDLSQADIVAVFLYPRLLERLRPQFAKMKPGSRIVSHQFLMPDVEPDQVITLESTETGERHTLYLWTTPLKEASANPR
jgi:outer membrane protein assembly factor BamB